MITVCLVTFVLFFAVSVSHRVTQLEGEGQRQQVQFTLLCVESHPAGKNAKEGVLLKSMQVTDVSTCKDRVNV